MAETQVPTQPVAEVGAARDSVLGQSNGDEQELLTCLLDDVEFGISIHAVQEIVRLPKITPVPKAPPYVRGLANLRGNVLPVIEPRLRFGMASRADDDRCRVVVVELAGTATGMIVDAVREVLHVENSAIEPAPRSVRGVDSKFLTGVVKLENGKRLVMLIDPDQVIDLNDFVSETAEETSYEGPRTSSRASSDCNAEQDCEQLVTFRLADEEYGVPIMEVQEIIRVPDITKVPNAPRCIQGIASLRNRVLPIMDLRAKFGFHTLAAEMEAMVDTIRGFEKSHMEIYQRLKEAVDCGDSPVESFDHEDCEFTRWYRGCSPSDPALRNLIDPLYSLDKEFHEASQAVCRLLAEGSVAEARGRFEQLFPAAHDHLKTAFRKLFRAIARRDDERCLVVNVGGKPLALRIDAVNEVLQVEKSSVEATPEVVAGREELKDSIQGVAKLQQGKRLIMILDVQTLVGERELDELTAGEKTSSADSSHQEKGTSTMDTCMEEDECQFVSFRVGEEEFATDIMQVQEIIRLEKVTAVPHAPSFVQGVVNLRGNVLPVVDLRKRFDMEPKQYNDATRVVVVDVNERKTGIIVDSVSEVMSLPKRSIEPAPPIVKASYGDDFIEGVGKINGGERMVLVLRMDRLLSDEQMAAFRAELAADDRAEPEKASVPDGA